MKVWGASTQIGKFHVLFGKIQALFPLGMGPKFGPQNSLEKSLDLHIHRVTHTWMPDKVIPVWARLCLEGNATILMEGNSSSHERAIFQILSECFKQTNASLHVNMYMLQKFLTTCWVIILLHTFYLRGLYFRVNWREHRDTKIKSSPIISNIRRKEQDRQNFKNKVSWKYGKAKNKIKRYINFTVGLTKMHNWCKLGEYSTIRDCYMDLTKLFPTGRMLITMFTNLIDRWKDEQGNYKSLTQVYRLEELKAI